VPLCSSMAGLSFSIYKTLAQLMPRESVLWFLYKLLAFIYDS
jgi:hypothetical protein